MSHINCNCCVFKNVQNCPLHIHRPMWQILWDEKLINVQHIENDIKVYGFYRKLFSRSVIIKPSFLTTTVLLGDRVEQLANYYVYCYGYAIRFTGEREILVGVIDWQSQAYVTAAIICGIYPYKVYRKNVIDTRPMRTVASIRNCTTFHATYTSDSAGPRIELILDRVITIILHDYTAHENKLQQTVLRRFGACLSIRLVQFLKYAVHLQATVKKYCYSNCRCGGFGDECRCPVARGCFKEFPDARKLCSDEVFFEAPLPDREKIGKSSTKT